MSEDSKIYKSFVELGMDEVKAKKIEKELIKKAKSNPMLTKDELSKELNNLSKKINKLSNKLSNKTSNKLSINYNEIINGLIIAGILELLVFLKSWLSCFFAGVPSAEMEHIMKIRMQLREYINKGFSNDISDSLLEYAVEFEMNKNEILYSMIFDNNKSLTSKEIETIRYFLDDLIELVETKHIKELKLEENLTKPRSQ